MDNERGYGDVVFVIVALGGIGLLVLCFACLCPPTSRCPDTLMRTYTDNITITSTDFGGWGPYHIIATDGYDYEVPRNRNLEWVYDTAARYHGSTAQITVEEWCHNGITVKKIVGITITSSNCCNTCCNGCYRCCGGCCK